MLPESEIFLEPLATCWAATEIFPITSLSWRLISLKDWATAPNSSLRLVSSCTRRSPLAKSMVFSFKSSRGVMKLLVRRRAQATAAKRRAIQTMITKVMDFQIALVTSDFGFSITIVQFNSFTGADAARQSIPSALTYSIAAFWPEKALATGAIFAQLVRLEMYLLSGWSMTFPLESVR